MSEARAAQTPETSSPRDRPVGSFLTMLLRPLQAWLESPDIVEIAVNEPGVVWIERLGSLAMERHDVPELTELAIRKLAQVVATTTRQALGVASTPGVIDTETALRTG